MKVENIATSEASKSPPKPPPVSSRHAAAYVWLVIATVLWGISFPVIKSILLRQGILVPQASSAFLAALAAAVRFGAAALVMAVAAWRTLPTLTWSEFRQGLSLAFFGGVGILLQMDGLAHTAASTSAFLTQFYCLILPIWAAVKSRTSPSLAAIVSCVLVVSGAAVLTGVDLRHLSMGRGELETLVAALFFSGQILCLGNPKYGANRTGNFTVVMFALTALLNAPVALAFMPTPRALLDCYADWPVVFMMIILVLPCTVGAYMLMNYWQRNVTPTQAGIIYCLEPVAASAFALFMPAWLSWMAAIEYANERLTRALFIGGLLILVANVLIQLEGSKPRKTDTMRR